MSKPAPTGVPPIPVDQLAEDIAKAIFAVRDDPYDTNEWFELHATDREMWECYARDALPVIEAFFRPHLAAAWYAGWAAVDSDTENPWDVTP